MRQTQRQSKEGHGGVSNDVFTHNASPLLIE
jgi:hypothetical protein